MSGDATTWIKELSSHDVELRRRAASELSGRGADARPAAAALVPCAGDPDEIVRESAVAALESLGEPNESDVASLSALMNSDKADVAYWAITLIGRLGAQGGAAIPQLVAALDDHAQTSVRERAAWALGRIGPNARPAISSLQSAAGGTYPRLSRLARQALEQIGG